MIGRQLPHDAAAELSVLGSCLRWGPEAIADVRSVIGDHGMCIEAHQACWDALQMLVEKGRSIDRITLESELRSRGTLGTVGGPQAIARVAETCARNKQELLVHAVLIAEHAQARAAIELARAFAQQLLTNPLTGDELAAELARTAERFTDVARNGAGGKRGLSIKQVGDDWEREFQLELSGRTRSISTGFAKLDSMCKRRGPRPGWLLFVSGRPKMGKTSFALQVLIEAMFDRVDGFPVRWKLKDRPTPVFIVCDEMRNAELYERLLANLAGLDASAIGAPTQRWYEHNRERVDAARKLLDSAPIEWCPDEHSGDLRKAFGIIRRWRSEHPIIDRDQQGRPVREPALVMLDFLQSFVDFPETAKQNINERTGAKVKFVKDESKALGLVSLLLSQLNRDLEKRPIDDESGQGRRPQASDNEGSGKIEQYGDVLMGCYRPVVYDPKHQEYRDQIKILRKRAVDGCKNTGIGVARMLNDLDELIAIRNDQAQQRRFELLLHDCPLGRTEVQELASATTKLSTAEIIVQLNRHGPTGTVYADFFGQFYRFLPRNKSQQEAA